MACKNVCRLCPRLIISQAVTFADGTLTVNIPAGSYANGEKYCIVVAQTRPATTTIDAPVVITIGAGTETYPLTGCDCAQLTACAIQPRTKYATVVSTNAAGGGTFRLLGQPKYCAPDSAPALTGAAATAGGGETS